MKIVQTDRDLLAIKFYKKSQCYFLIVKTSIYSKIYKFKIEDIDFEFKDHACAIQINRGEGHVFFAIPIKAAVKIIKYLIKHYKEREEKCEDH